MVNIEQAFSEATYAAENSWDRERRTIGYKTIWEAHEGFRLKVLDRYQPEPNQKAVETYPDLAYQAVSALLNASRELLQNPVAVANVTVPNSGQSGAKNGLVNHSRNGFMHNLAKVCHTLNITADDLARALEQLEKRST